MRAIVVRVQTHAFHPHGEKSVGTALYPCIAGLPTLGLRTLGKPD